MIKFRDHLLSMKPRGAIFTTYAFSPAFFEAQVARPLLEAGCTDLFVLVDRVGYDAVVAERAALIGAGRDYWISPVDIFRPSAFHPKVVLMWSDDETRLYVSSANLTQAGLGRNVEIVDFLYCTRDSHSSAASVHAAISWLGQIAELLPVRAESELRQLLDKAILGLPADSQLQDDAYFLHNLDRPLLDQICELPVEEVLEITAIAPFHQPDLSPVAALAKAFPKATISVAQGQDATAINPEAPAFRSRRVQLRTCITPKNRYGMKHRYLHGKVLLLKSSASSVLITGSANMTRAGFLAGFGEGNAEAVLARISLDPGSYDSLLKSKVTLRRIKAESLRYVPPATARSEARRATVAWAELSGLTLKIWIENVEANDRAAVSRVSLITAEGRRTVKLATRPSVDKACMMLEVPLPRGFAPLFDKPVCVEIQARTLKRSEYYSARALVVVPDLIRAGYRLKRTRSAASALARGEFQDEDLRDVVDFVRDQLTTLFAIAPTNVRNPTVEPGSSASGADVPDDRPGVILGAKGEDEEILPCKMGHESTVDLLNQLPGIFKRILEAGSAPTVQADDESLDNDEADEDDTGPAGETDDRSPVGEKRGTLAEEHVREFFLWAIQTLRIGAEDETHNRPGDVYGRVYLLDFALKLAQFFFLSRHAEVTPESQPAREYLRTVSQLLSHSLSIAGAAFGLPVGSIARAPNVDGESVRTLRSIRQLVPTVLYHLAELTQTSKGEPGTYPIREILGGCDHLVGSASKDTLYFGAVVNALLVQRANVFLAGRSSDEVRNAIAELRILETPEQVALRKFPRLLELQKATGHCFAAKEDLASVSKQLADLNNRIDRYSSTRSPNYKKLVDERAALLEQRESFVARLASLQQRQAHLREGCSTVAPEEIAAYDQMVNRGRWKVFVPIRRLGEQACPGCHVQFHQRIATQLYNLTKAVPCPHCSMLIVPVPISEGHAVAD